MSRSIHITRKNFKGLTVKELDEQANDPTSELKQWSVKSTIKKEVKKTRKKSKDNNSTE
jgi:hypothetical protein